MFSLTGYSGSDVANLCREAALGPIRSMRFEDIENIEADQVSIYISWQFVICIHFLCDETCCKDFACFQYGVLL